MDLYGSKEDINEISGGKKLSYYQKTRITEHLAQESCRIFLTGDFQEESRMAEKLYILYSYKGLY